MSSGLYNGVSGLALGVGLYKGVSGLWSGASGLVTGFGGADPFSGASLYLNMLSGSLDSRVTFTRSTTGTFVGSNGLIQSAAVNVPRFDYNPVTRAPLGLLIEETRTNLLLRSEEFNDAAWSKSGATITANAAVAPDGASTADKLVENLALVQHRASQAPTVTNGIAYTYSVFLKAAERTKAWVRIIGAATYASANIDLADGTLSAVTGTATATNYGNGWYRVTVSGTSDSTTATCYVNLLDATGQNTYTGDGTSGIFVWGAQLEAGGFATSYIPTVAVPVPRNADIATMTGTNFSSWYNASEGTFFASFEASPNTFTTYLAASNGVVAQNSIHMDNDGSGNMRATYYSGSTQVAPLTLGPVGTLGAVNNMATAYKVNDFAASRNGGTAVVDTLGAVPVGVNRLNIGADPSGAAVNVSNTHIRQIAYFNTRLSDVQLEALALLPPTLSLNFLNDVYEG